MGFDPNQIGGDPLLDTLREFYGGLMEVESNASRNCDVLVFDEACFL